MEWKIGEIRQVDDEWYQCIRDITCINCGFNNKGCLADKHITGDCSGRLDGASVVFKKLEKVGEPYIFSNMSIHNITMQRYKVFIKPIFTDNSIFTTYNTLNETISIEIKNKGNMKMKKVFMNGDDRDYLLDRLEDILHDNHCLEYKDEIFNSFCKYITSNNRELKPFDLEAAKSGKPVCTRDGRKARIICFDRINGDYYKIVACVTAFDGDFEEVLFYGIDGYIVDSQNPKDEDLMMLLEKKEGWANVYREETNNNERLIEQTIYKTRKDAFDNACPKGYITTTKINWEE